MGKVNKRTSNCDCWLERLPKVSLNVNSSQQYPYILHRYKTQKRLNKEKYTSTLCICKFKWPVRTVIKKSEILSNKRIVYNIVFEKVEILANNRKCIRFF